MQWFDNVAYGSSSDSVLKPEVGRHYNTVPHASRNQKFPVTDRKYATISTAGKPYNNYPNVDNGTGLPQKHQLPVDGYEPGDSLSSLSSRSKDSLGSQGGDEPQYASVQKKIEYFKGLDSPKDRYPQSAYWRPDVKVSRAEDKEHMAPLAKQEVCISTSVFNPWRYQNYSIS